MSTSRIGPGAGSRLAELTQPKEEVVSSEITESETNSSSTSRTDRNAEIQITSPKLETSSGMAATLRFEQDISALSKMAQLQNREPARQESQDCLASAEGADPELRLSKHQLEQIMIDKALSAQPSGSPNITHDHQYQHNQTDIEFEDSERQILKNLRQTREIKLSLKNEQSSDPVRKKR